MAGRDSCIMVSNVGLGASMPGWLDVYVNAIDATYRRALEAGAISLEAHWREVKERIRGD